MGKYYRYVFVALTKGSAAFAALLLTYAVTYFLTPVEAGYFFLGFTFLSVMSVFFRVGLDNVILREFAKVGVSRISLQLLFRGVLWSLSAMLPILILVYLFRVDISVVIFSKPEMVEVIYWVVLSTPLIVLMMLASFAFHGVQMYGWATFFQNAGYSFLFCLLLVLSSAYGAGELDSGSSMKLIFYSSLFLLMVLLFKCRNTLIRGFRGIRYFDYSMWTSSVNLWLASCMTLSVTWSSIVFTGVFSPAEDVAYLSTAQRVAQLISFILLVVNAVSAPVFARLWARKDYYALEKIAKKSSRAMALMAFPMVIVFVSVPEHIMRLFGDDFEKAAGLLTVMAVGQFINVSTGCVGYLLSMSGHDKDFRRVTFVSGPIAIFLSFFLTDYYGVLGAAYATALSLSIHNFLAFYMVKKRLGFWPI